MPSSHLYIIGRERELNALHVIHRYWPCAGGSEKYFQEISERLADEGHSVTVMTTDARDPEYFWLRDKDSLQLKEEMHNGVVVRRAPVQHLPMAHVLYHRTRQLMILLSGLPLDTTPILAMLSRTTPLIPTLRQQLRAAAGDADIVHVANVLLESLVAPALDHARARDIPFVLTPFVHLGTSENDPVRQNYTNRYQLSLIKAADKVIVQTDIELRYLESKGVPGYKLVKIGVGVNPEEVLGGDGKRFREKYNLDEPIVFYIGSQSFDKGIRDLVEAMKSLWQRGSKGKLVLAGATTHHFSRYFDAQPEWVKKNCVQLGVIPDDEKRDLLAAGDVFAMPSRTDSFGIVFLEAWLYEKPVIGALAGGIPDVVTDGKDGLIVRFGDVPHLSDCIQNLLTDSRLAQALGERGHAKVLREHTWDKKFSLIAQQYKELGA